MSLSALGSQLAALNKTPGSGTVGSSLSNSKRHEDAIGRGLTHSVQTGYSAANKSAIHKPSIIYEDSRKASDVPLTTIRENCVASLRELEEMDPVFGSFVESLCNQNAPERALMTSKDNERVDKTIDDLMYRLALHMNSQTTIVSCLHVMEFLIRRYDIHARAKTATTILLVFLSHHEQPYFLRLLQLIDLASMPTWTFLRPFAIQGARVARLEFSKHASKDTAFVRELCRLAQRNGKLQNSSKVASTTVSKSLSFIAAVLVEAMSLQTRKTGTMHESMCQAVLPFVATACKQSKRLAFQNWGHVVVSAMVEHCVLAAEPRKLLITSILHGAKDPKVPEMNVLNAILVTLTILAQPLNETSSPDAIDSKMKVVGSLTSLGYTFEKGVFQAFAEIDNLAPKLGHLFAVEGISDVVDLVVSLLVVAWLRLQQKKGDDEKQEVSLRLIIQLIQDPNLKELWTENESTIVNSYTAFLLSNSGDSPKEFISPLKQILKELHQKDAIAYDNGLAHALMRSKKGRRLQIADLLGLKKIDALASDASEATLTIPPRVALEHADARIRLEAISQVVEEAKNEDSMDTAAEALHLALLRRFAVDDDSDVLCAAGDALCTLLCNARESNLETFDIALELLRKWVSDTSFDPSFRCKVLVRAFTIAIGYLPDFVTIEDAGFVSLVESLAVCTDDPNTDVASKASQSLLGLLNRKKKATGKKTVAEEVQLALITNGKLLQAIKSTKTTSITESNIRRRFLATLMKAWGNCIERMLAKKKPQVCPSMLSSEAFDFCLWVLELRDGSLNKKEEESLKKCLLLTAKAGKFQSQDLPGCLCTLASLPRNLFQEVAVPFIDSVCKTIVFQKEKVVPRSAVLLECALRSSTRQGVENLLSTVTFNEDDSGLLSFVPLLALLTDPDEKIRKKVVELIGSIENTLQAYENKEWKILGDLSLYITKNSSSAVLGGKSFLPKAFAAVVEGSKQQSQFRLCILKLCVCAAAVCHSDDCSSEEAFHQGWLPIGTASGGLRAASIILEAAELSSEDTFPLDLRWKFGGSLVLKGLLTSDLDNDGPTSSLLDLTEICVRMLKGVTVLDAASINEEMPKVGASPGPGKGRRSRSYSISKGDGLQFIQPYPKDMEKVLITILESESSGCVVSKARSIIFDSIFSSQSWGDGIFRMISAANRRRIELLVLKCAVSNTTDGAADALFALPIEAEDILAFMDDQDGIGREFSSISYLSDYVSSNAPRIAGSKNASALLGGMFDMLRTISSTKVENAEEADFARQSIMVSLLSLLDVLKDAVKRSPVATFKSWFQLLGNLLSTKGAENTGIRSVESFRQRSQVLSLMTSLAAIRTKDAVEYLVPALLLDISSAETRGEARFATDSFSAIIPLYCEHATSVGMSLSDLFNSFVSSTAGLSDVALRSNIYESFVKALEESQAREKEGYSSIGSLVAIVIATKIRDEALSSTTESDDVSVLLQRAHQTIQLPSMISLVAYAKFFLADILDEDRPDEQVAFLSSSELQASVIGGPSRKKSTKDKKEILAQFCFQVLVQVNKVLGSASLQKFIRRQSQGDPGLSLRLWQDLLILQSICFNQTSGKQEERGDEMANWDSMSELIKEALDKLQMNLPTHMFLAFVTSLIKEGESEDLRARAVRLLSDRVPMIAPGTPEVSLFVDLVPFLSRLVEAERSHLLQQSAIVAVESIARLVCSDAASPSSQHQDVFASIVALCAGLLAKNSLADGVASTDPATLHLVCSTAICASTSIRVCGPRCLPSLPSLMKSLVDDLSCANHLLLGGSGIVIERINQAKLVQLSVVRSLICVAEKLPQFLVPYLNIIFAPAVFPSDALRLDSDEQSLTVKSVTARLESTLSKNVPTRQLVPATASGIKNASTEGGVLALLSLLTASVKLSTSIELASQRGPLVRIAMTSFDFGGQENSKEVLDATNDLIVSLVLKLSEIQLRPLYAKLQEWRGESNVETPLASITRRRAFWGLSSRLAKELKAIFLPCLTGVFTEVVDELLLACSILLPKQSSKKLPGGKKKQRLLPVSGETINEEYIETLASLLGCLDSSLRADAHSGGQWTRADDASRYNTLLEPLGKLLLCQINTKDADSTKMYFGLVMGPQGGNIINTIVSLASAAGDEQLWKPLNHAVLQACSNEDRAEVRKAGVSCLLALIQSLGEEYMVLLPECLPILSELLEDSDEELVGLAQECISTSEDLLGESLQESLR